MKIRNIQRHGEEKIELQMTPMIDIVFQLLVFFVMTFKIAAMEGDFSITMPQAPSEGQPDPNQLPPIVVRLQADDAGTLTRAVLNAKTLTGDTWDLQLNSEIRSIVGDVPEQGAGGAEPEVELDCDYNLKYKYVIDAITAVSGYKIEVDGKERVVPLVEKIRFSRLRKPTS